METEKPVAALQIAMSMLNDVPKDATVIDSDQAHVVQGMMMGAAYLLKHLFDKHGYHPQPSVAFIAASTASSISAGEGKSKKGKKKDQQQLPQEGKSQLQSGITAAIEQFLSILGKIQYMPRDARLGLSY